MRSKKVLPFVLRRGRDGLFAIATVMLTVALSALTPAAVSAEAEATSESLSWKHSTRDVYLNGELRPDIEVLTAEGSRWAVAVPEADTVLVLQPGEQDQHVVTKLPIRELEWSESRLQAESAVPKARDDARLFDFPDGVWIEWQHQGVTQHLVLSPHQGTAGPISLDQLWQIVPVWQSARDAYEPGADAVTVLESETRELTLKVFLGTWCGDSRRSVPRLLAALDAAENPKLEVELIAIGRGFTEPLDLVRRHRITNVPTILVMEGNHEIGRFIERPHGETVEIDLAALLDGRPNPPRPLMAQDDLLLASGRYGLFAAEGDHAGGDERIGDEHWRLFKTEDGGFRLHTQRLIDGRRTDTWHRRSGVGDTRFVEITRSANGELSRTRISFRDGLATSTTRGSEGGIVKQTAWLDEAGSRALAVAPSVAGWGFVWAGAGRPKTRLEGQGFVLPGAGEPTAGRVQLLTFDWLGRAGDSEPLCDEVSVGLGNQRGRLCLHPELDVPVSASWGSSRARLEALSIEPDVEQATPGDDGPEPTRSVSTP